MPSKWETIRIGDVADVVGGATPKSGTPEFWGGAIQWLTPKDLSKNPTRYTVCGERTLTEEGLRKSGAKLLPAGTVLLTSRAPVGYVSVAAGEIATNQGFKSLVLKDGQLPEFWYYLLGHSTDYLRANSGGSTFQEISGSTLKNLAFNIPPLAEQRRIVDVIGALDEGIEAADVAITHNRSVADRISNDAYAKAMSGEFPMTSLIKVLGDKGFIQTGPFGSQLHSHDYVEIGTPVVMPTNIKDGRVDVDGIARISDDDLERLRKHILRPGDIVWSRRGDVTRFAQITDEDEPMICGTGCLLIRPGHTKITSWLTVWLSSKNMQTIVMDRAVGATMLNLNTKILGSLPVVMPEADSPLPAVLAALGTSRAEMITHVESLRALRSEMLTSLLSGAHTIPESYDELLEAIAV